MGWLLSQILLSRTCHEGLSWNWCLQILCCIREFQLRSVCDGEGLLDLLQKVWGAQSDLKSMTWAQSQWAFLPQVIAEAGTKWSIDKMFLLSDSVPVVLGGKNRTDYEKVLPPKSFIHVEDFSSVEDLVNFITFIGDNETLLLRFQEWRKTFSIVQNHEFFQNPSQWVQLTADIQAKYRVRGNELNTLQYLDNEPLCSYDR